MQAQARSFDNSPDLAPTPGKRGFVLILSSPSGAGKTTLTRMLMTRQDLDLHLSVSVTTRARRHSEADGVHYGFVDMKRFGALKADDGLLEWAEVHGNHYGTPKEPVEGALAAGRCVVLDVDWQGAEQVKRLMPNDVVSVFVLPPSMPELRHRLERRAEDSQETIERRLANARREIAHWEDYDFALVNDDVQDTFNALLSIVDCERRRTSRAKDDTANLIGSLLAG